jgi:antitoxin (DNA-binding transcriptional repressor) of toxin-antitoxin stability system
MWWPRRETIRGQEGSVKTVKIAELKNRLSYYLRRVQQGESILVCDRDRVIARIERVGPDAVVPATDAEWLDRLERRGVIRRGTRKLSRKWLAARPDVTADVVAALLEERQEGR